MPTPPICFESDRERDDFNQSVNDVLTRSLAALSLRLRENWTRKHLAPEVNPRQDFEYIARVAQAVQADDVDPDDSLPVLPYPPDPIEGWTLRKMLWYLIRAHRPVLDKILAYKARLDSGEAQQNQHETEERFGMSLVNLLRQSVDWLVMEKGGRPPRS